MFDASLLAKLDNTGGVEPSDISLVDPAPAGLVDIWGRFYRLRGRTLVGRCPEQADLVVASAAISLVHAQFRFNGRDAVWELSDLGSTNGTYVQGKAVSGCALLSHQSVVTFGDVSFVFVELRSSTRCPTGRWR